MQWSHLTPLTGLSVLKSRGMSLPRLQFGQTMIIELIIKKNYLLILASKFLSFFKKFYSILLAKHCVTLPSLAQLVQMLLKW